MTNRFIFLEGTQIGDYYPINATITLIAIITDITIIVDN